MGRYINFNGELLPGDQPILKASSRGVRFGDAVFETMRMKGADLLFEEKHAHRLFNGLRLFRFKLPHYFNWIFLRNEIGRVVEANMHTDHSRVRMMVIRGEGAITEEPTNSPQFIIESWPADKYTFNPEGLKLGIDESCRKSVDRYSNIKSSNFLPSVMASIFARENGFDECIMLNSNNRVCDGSISNVFWIKDDKIFTPPLSEGCIAGVTRRYLLEELPERKYNVEEKVCAIDNLLNADEVFLTNTIRGIRWVESFKNRKFGSRLISRIFEEVIAPLTL